MNYVGAIFLILFGGVILFYPDFLFILFNTKRYYTDKGMEMKRVQLRIGGLMLIITGIIVLSIITS